MTKKPGINFNLVQESPSEHQTLRMNFMESDEEQLSMMKIITTFHRYELRIHWNISDARDSDEVFTYNKSITKIYL